MENRGGVGGRREGEGKGGKIKSRLYTGILYVYYIVKETEKDRSRQLFFLTLKLENIIFFKENNTLKIRKMKTQLSFGKL